MIYKLCCLDLSITDIYIGSTTSKYRRKHAHKSACNNPNDEKHNYYLYRFIRQHGGWDNWDFVEIEQYNAKNKTTPQLPHDALGGDSVIPRVPHDITHSLGCALPVQSKRPQQSMWTLLYGMEIQSHQAHQIKWCIFHIVRNPQIRCGVRRGG